MTDTGVDPSKAVDGARDAHQQLRETRGYQGLVAVGLGAYGLVHLLIAWISLRIAWGGGGDASQEGALGTLARTGAGPALLVVVALGMLALVIWQVAEAVFGQGRAGAQQDRFRRIRKRLSSAGRAAVYLVLGVSALRLVIGARSSGEQEESLTGRLLALPLGRVLVFVVAAAVLAIGISQIVRGVRKKFTEDLTGDKTRPVLALGTAGYIAKGLALAIVAGLFGWAAATVDADKAGGLDAALHTVSSQPQGAVLLSVLALGFAAFGVFCFVWARNARS